MIIAVNAVDAVIPMGLEWTYQIQQSITQTINEGRLKSLITYCVQFDVNTLNAYYMYNIFDLQ